METGKKQPKKSFAILLLILVLSLAYNSYGDAIAPRPNPMKWADVPATLGPTSITMTATTAKDLMDPPPVWYYFECTTDGTKTSGWQVNGTYTAIGLNPGTVYSFRVKARDSAVPTNNETGWSLTLSATTDADTTPPVLRLDVDDAAVITQPGFTSFLLSDSGKTINGITIDLGGSIRSALRDNPVGDWVPYGGGIPGNYYYPRAGERIYRDFIHGISPSGVTITLWGLGVNQDCNIAIWAYDDESIGDANRVAHWYANGMYIFDTNFIGGPAGWPRYDNQAGGAADLYKYACHYYRATADVFGRIALTSFKGPNSPETEPFAFVNALKVEPNALIPFVPTPRATRPQPIDNEEDVNVIRLLQWTNGAGADKHDLYLGDNFDDVNDANRSNTHGVLIGPDLAVNANAGYDPCRGGANNEFLALDTTYYWRVDENDFDTSTVYEGEVWSFSTLPYYYVDDFNSYTSDVHVQQVWKDYQQPPYTCSRVYLATAPNLGGYSVEYQFLNKNSPYYAEVNATIGTGTHDLKIDPNWSGINAKSLTMYFYGKGTNDANKPMYVTLADSDTPVHTKKVLYSAYGDMNDIREAEWHEWNIPLADFTGVNLHKVKTIVIGFGDKTKAATNGTVWFENIMLWTTRCALKERSDDFAEIDYAPLGNPGGNCMIDYQEIEVMANAWLERDALIRTNRPGDSNLVIWYPLNEGAGNNIFNHLDTNNPDVLDPSGKWTGTFSNSGVSWATPGAPYIGGTGCAYFDGAEGTRIQCGTVWGNLRLGIGSGKVYPNDVNAMTVSVWAKWLGPRTWDAYLMSESQGLLGKKRGWWDDQKVVWMFECDTPGKQGSFALRHYAVDDTSTPDVYSANGILNPYIGQWVHLAATFPHPAPDPATDANSHARLYFNGGQVASGPWRFSLGDDINIYLTIGNTTDEIGDSDSPESFNGYIDEVRIYNRALEPNEIAYLSDMTPLDLLKWILIPSPAEVYDKEPEGQRAVNFKDFALVVNRWLTEEMFPR